MFLIGKVKQKVILLQDHIYYDNIKEREHMTLPLFTPL